MLKKIFILPLLAVVALIFQACPEDISNCDNCDERYQTCNGDECECKEGWEPSNNSPYPCVVSQRFFGAYKGIGNCIGCTNLDTTIVQITASDTTLSFVIQSNSYSCKANFVSTTEFEIVADSTSNPGYPILGGFGICDIPNGKISYTCLIKNPSGSGAISVNFSDGVKQE